MNHAIASKRNPARRKGISPILATIILIVITVVAGVMLYGFVTGFFSSSATANNANLETSLVIPSGASQGTFTLTVKNAGTTDIKTINVTLYSPSGATIAKVNWAYSTAPLAPGQEVTITVAGTNVMSSSGIATPSSLPSTQGINSTSVISGSSYNYVVQIAFANGASKTYTGSVTASAF